MIYSEELEKSVLGVLLDNPHYVAKVFDTLLPDYFYNDANRYIYKIVRTLHSSRKLPSLEAVIHEIKRSRTEKLVGSLDYLSELSISASSPRTLKYNIEHLQELHLRRRIKEVTSTLSDKLTNTQLSLSDIITKATKAITDIASEKVTDNFSYLKDMLAGYEQKREDGVLCLDHMKPGYKRLDATLSLKPGQLVVVAARTSVGKTAFAINIAKMLSIESNKTGLFFSLEMTKDELLKRFVACVGGINGYSVDKGEFNAVPELHLQDIRLKEEAVERNDPNQAMLNTVVAQREKALNDVANMACVIAELQNRIVDLEAQLAEVPQVDTKALDDYVGAIAKEAAE